MQGVAPPAPPPDAGASASVSPDAAPPKIDFQETEFAETDRSRDPFRANAALFVEEVRGRVRSQREVVLDDYSLDELKLVGIVTRIAPAGHAGGSQRQSHVCAGAVHRAPRWSVHGLARAILRDQLRVIELVRVTS